jgi:Rhodanese-like domain
VEWCLDPTCPYHIPEAANADVRIIIVCNEGFSSSLAAATLQQLGLHRATDLVGGFQAWKQYCEQGDSNADLSASQRAIAPCDADKSVLGSGGG